MVLQNTLTKVVLLLSLMIGVFTKSLESKINKKPNIVLLISDDHGLDVGVYGNSAIKTPNFDSLAKESMIFTNAFATTASCSTSIFVFLAELYSHCNGHYGQYNHFSSFDAIKSLPVLLNDFGYKAIPFFLCFATAVPHRSDEVVAVYENNEAIFALINSEKNVMNNQNLSRFVHPILE